jgi:hypothetical protein
VVDSQTFVVLSTVVVPSVPLVNCPVVKSAPLALSPPVVVVDKLSWLPDSEFPASVVTSISGLEGPVGS